MEEKNLEKPGSDDSKEMGVDDILLSLIGDGDPAALSRFYKNKSRFIYSLVLNIVRNDTDAEEITEDVFLKIWQNARSFDRSRGVAMAWVATIARRLAIDRTRSKYYKDRGREVDIESHNADNSENVMVGDNADTTTAGIEAREIKEALDQIGDTHRELIRLSYFEGYSHSMIAEKLKTPLGTVKTRIREAVVQLRGILDVKV